MNYCLQLYKKCKVISRIVRLIQIYDWIEDCQAQQIHHVSDDIGCNQQKSYLPRYCLG